MGADVHLEKCQDGDERQQWDLTGDGNVKVTGSEECLDVKAELKEDGTREKFDEIKEHKVVNVHLYKCHDPEKTERVNQLWSWVPYQQGKPVTAKTVQEWEAKDLGLSGSTPVITVALAGAVAVGLFSLGALTGKRMHRGAEKPLASLAEE